MRTIAWITSKNEQFDIKDIEARKTKLNIEDLPEGLSGFKNDIGFIDRTVSNLLNYYTKNETYNREKINELVSARLLIKIVDKLPTSDISTSTIYFLKRKKEQGTTQYESDVYDEYIYVDGTWELIGNTYVDLTNYYTKSETESKIDEKVAIETQNRTLADNTLQNNIDIVQTNVDNVNNSLNSEIVTRQNKDLSHETKMTEIETNLNSEISRATNAENTLSNRCDNYDKHLSNTSNPHSVTAEQIGLGNVTNVSTTDTITLNSENNITSGAVYTALENKVDKVSGKGLSDQNFTLAEKTKLSGLKNYDDTSISNRVTATENAITTLNGNSSVSGSVDKKIADAIAGVTQLDFKIVSELPSTGIKGTIYLIRGTGTETTQQYDEYIWVDGKWEKLGKSTIEVDLSDIYLKSEVNALVSVKNDKITITDDNSTALTDADTFSTTSNSGTNPTNLTKRPLSLLWNYIKGKISSVLGLTKDTYSGKASTAGTADYARNMYYHNLNLSALDKTKFYPLVGYSDTDFAEVAICSESGMVYTEYNQNRIHFDISTKGWSDTPFTLNIREYTCYENNEITIGCIGSGNHNGAWAIWLRGGLHYTCFSRNADLSLHTSNYTFGDEVYTVGTNYYGGSNTNVNVVFTPQSTITNGSYSTRAITAPNITSLEESASEMNTAISTNATNLSNHISNKSNPHGVTKEQVGLGSVVNTGDSATPVSGGTTKFTTGGAYTELNKKQDKITITDDSSTVLTDTHAFVTFPTGTNPRTGKQRQMLQVWTYIKGKIKSDLGLTGTEYAGNSATATNANKVSNPLIFGSKTFNGSSAQIIEASDLGISTVSFSQFCPDLSKIQKVRLAGTNLTHDIPFTVPEDGWVLCIISYSFNNDKIIRLIIDGKTNEGFPVVVQPWSTQVDSDIRNCPFPVRKNQVLSVNLTYPTDVYINYAPCIGN